mmetsp:Transcript_47773/g.102405  ORF Transcript_47773/g.102405 Transcript_47773/m.102405 type:complete len:200 (+) Transcript_47773:139-738(+)
MVGAMRRLCRMCRAPCGGGPFWQPPASCLVQHGRVAPKAKRPCRASPRSRRRCPRGRRPRGCRERPMPRAPPPAMHSHAASSLGPVATWPSGAASSEPRRPRYGASPTAAMRTRRKAPSPPPPVSRVRGPAWGSQAPGGLRQHCAGAKCRRGRSPFHPPPSPRPRPPMLPGVRLGPPSPQRASSARVLRGRGTGCGSHL